jgi:SAM-dependent methyltransferase
MAGPFDTDTAALRERERLNQRGARYDLEEWILARVGEVRGRRLLDLGCGTGKQLFALAPCVGAGGSLLGIDISPQAVDAVNERARSEGLSFVRAEVGDLDGAVARVAGSHFDLILSSYAIYYAADVLALLRGLAARLAPGGQIFVCGPGAGTNREILALVDEVLPAGTPHPPDVVDFLTEEDRASLRGVYGIVETSRLDNVVTFADADAVIAWWENHNSFVAEARSAVAERITAHVAERGSFELSKYVLGVRLAPLM